jgi:hypothetical protein
MSRSKSAPVVVALLACLFVMVNAAQGQTTWYVDDNAPNDPGPGDPSVSDPDEDGSPEHPFDAIQEGIDAAVNGDTVLVLDGTYTGAGNRDIDFGGRAITVRSESGPDGCIIDCEANGRGLYFHGHETEASVVDGFAITNGSAWEGAGMFFEISSPTITRCVIRDGVAEYRGGGVSLTRSAPTFDNCLFGANRADYGGGMRVYTSQPTLVNCAFLGNRTGGAAAGISSLSSELVLVNCVFGGNRAGVDAGGMYNWAHTRSTLINCAFVGNHAYNRGGGVYAGYYSQVSLINCTFSGNAAGLAGGAVWCTYHSDVSIANCLLWGDAAPSGPELALSYHVGPATIAASYSDIEGGRVYVYVFGDCDLLWGPANIDETPRFVDADGPDDDPNTWADNDYHLGPGSPCIDAGDNFAVSSWIVTDLDGMPRFWDDPDTPDTGEAHGNQAVVDMGPYEFGSEGCPDDDGDGFVTICHIPPGHPERARTITVPVQAVAAHLAHGDYCGPCNGEGDGEAAPTGHSATGAEASLIDYVEHAP